MIRTNEYKGPTMMNGGIAPSVRRIELIEVVSLIGAGVDGDPYRNHYFYYTTDGVPVLSREYPLEPEVLP